MRAVDTNVLVRLLTRDDAKQVTAAEAFIKGGAWVSHLVLMEATWVLSTVYDVSAADLAVAIEMLLNHKALTLHDADVVAAALQRFQDKPALGFSDCLVREVSRKAGHIPLGTFDRNLGKVEDAQRI